MRTRPFISAAEAPRPFGEILAERRALDPQARLLERTLEDVLDLEAAAQACADPAERKRLQCEAEGLRCALEETSARRRA